VKNDCGLWFKEVMNTNPVTNGFVKPVPTEEEQAKVT
jgi:hypothetical protein